jgi:Fis family transcriptional regulator, factor for inversion stimulation protein
MPPQTKARSRSNGVCPVAVLVAPEGKPHPLSGKLERAGFEVRAFPSSEEARREAQRGALLCDVVLVADKALADSSMEQLIRARLALLLDRLGEEPIEGFYALVIREVERGMLRLVMDRCNGHRGQAAKQLGLHRNTLRQKLADLGLEQPPVAESRRRS